MSDRELFMYDVRVRDRFLTEGVITKADVDRRLEEGLRRPPA